VTNYTLSGLTLEVVWSDIEYMPKFWTMEFDPGAQRSSMTVLELTAHWSLPQRLLCCKDVWGAVHPFHM
jgi:hypothetical protein